MAQSFFSSIIKPQFKNLKPCFGVRPLDVLTTEIGFEVSELNKLDANENLYGPPEQVLNEIKNVNLFEYPDPNQSLLKEVLSKFLGVQESQIICSAGLDDLIDTILKIVKSGPIVSCSPTFVMYSHSAFLNNLEYIDVPRLPDFTLNIEKLLQVIEEKNPTVLFITSPNNPTGNLVPLDQIEILCQKNLLLVIDEAYIEFSTLNYDSTLLLPKYKNLVIMRSFSKWAGLAGIRIGYGIADSEIIEKIHCVKQPYNINVVAQTTAIASINYRNLILSQLKAIKNEKNKLFECIPKRFPWIKPLPSEGNFLLMWINPDVIPASDMYIYLYRLGLLTRYYFDTPQLKNYIRITIGKPENTESLFNAISLIEKSQLKNFKINNYDAILFDMDGVIADESHSFRQTIITLCKNYGVDVTLDDISAYKSNGGSNSDYVTTFDLISKHSSRKPDMELIKKQFEEIYWGSENEPGLYLAEKLIPKISLIKHLASLLPLAIVTGRPRNSCHKFLETHNLEPYFKVVTCMEDAEQKPSPQPIFVTLEKLGINKDNSKILFIGDTPNDIQAANSAQVDSFAILAPQEKKNPQMMDSLLKKKPTAFIKDLQELRLIFTKIIKLEIQ